MTLTPDRWSRRRRAGGAVGALLLVGLLAGCAANASDEAASVSSGGMPGGADSAEIAPAVPGYAPDESSRSGDAAAGAPQQVPGQVQVVGRSLVQSVQISVEVPEPDVSAREVRTTAVAAGGFVAEEQTGPGNAWVVVRVPVEALDRVADQVGGLGEVTSRSSSVVDVTDQVIDLDARVASQQAAVDRIRALLARAETIGDIVSIESELSTRQAELDSLTGRLAAVQEQVALSTLTVDLREPGETPVAGPDGFLGGLATGWEGLLAFGTGVGVVIGFVLPFVPVIALVVGLWIVAARALRRRRAARPAPAGPSAGPWGPGPGPTGPWGPPQGPQGPPPADSADSGAAPVPAGAGAGAPGEKTGSSPG